MKTVLIIVAIIALAGAYYVYTPDTSTDVVVTECKKEQRNVDACIEIYQPVCASIQVQCVTTLCDPVKETFANSCKACSNSLVSTYTAGECPSV